MKILYSVPAFGADTIQVYGDPENGWYEWRIVGESGKTLQDTGTEHGYGCSGRQYGVPEIALRDALMVASDLPDPYKGGSMFRIEDAKAGRESPHR